MHIKFFICTQLHDHWIMCSNCCMLCHYWNLVFNTHNHSTLFWSSISALAWTSSFTTLVCPSADAWRTAVWPHCSREEHIRQKMRCQVTETSSTWSGKYGTSQPTCHYMLVYTCACMAIHQLWQELFTIQNISVTHVHSTCITKSQTSL